MNLSFNVGKKGEHAQRTHFIESASTERVLVGVAN